jgi:excisionase family DNA binding protein
MQTTNLLSVDEAAARLGVSKYTLRGWLFQRRLPHVKLGRRVLVDPADIERFIQDNRIEVAPFFNNGRG